MAAAQPLRSEDGTVRHGLRPGDVLLDRHRQSAADHTAEDRPERRPHHVIRYPAGRQQTLHAADVDETRSAATAKDSDELLVTDFGIQFGEGKVVSVPLGEQPPQLVLVVDQTRQHVARCRQRRCRVALLEQRSTQGVGDPGPPRRDLGADRDVPAPARPVRARGPGSKSASLAKLSTYRSFRSCSLPNTSGALRLCRTSLFSIFCSANVGSADANSTASRVSTISS